MRKPLDLTEAIGKLLKETALSIGEIVAVIDGVVPTVQQDTERQVRDHITADIQAEIDSGVYDEMYVRGLRSARYIARGDQP